MYTNETPRLNLWDHVKDSAVVPWRPEFWCMLPGVDEVWRYSATEFLTLPLGGAQYQIPRRGSLLVGLHIRSNVPLIRPALTTAKLWEHGPLEVGQFQQSLSDDNDRNLWIWTSKSPLPVSVMQFSQFNVSLRVETLLSRSISELLKVGMLDSSMSKLMPQMPQVEVDAFWLEDTYWRRNSDEVMNQSILVDLDPILIWQARPFDKRHAKNAFQNDESLTFEFRDWSKYRFPGEEVVTYHHAINFVHQKSFEPIGRGVLLTQL